jgi:hypothetical protein
LVESWKHIPKLQRLATSKARTLEEQAQWLHIYIDERLAGNEMGQEAREEMLAALSLQSEIYSLLDFDKMIDAREKFQSLFPEHFAEYLRGLESLSWQITWPGCLECSHFTERCELGLSPSSIAGDHVSVKTCSSKESRLDAA